MSYIIYNYSINRNKIIKVFRFENYFVLKFILKLLIKTSILMYYFII